MGRPPRARQPAEQLPNSRIFTVSTWQRARECGAAVGGVVRWVAPCCSVVRFPPPEPSSKCCHESVTPPGSRPAALRSPAHRRPGTSGYLESQQLPPADHSAASPSWSLTCRVCTQQQCPLALPPDQLPSCRLSWPAGSRAVGPPCGTACTWPGWSQRQPACWLLAERQWRSKWIRHGKWSCGPSVEQHW